MAVELACVRGLRTKDKSWVQLHVLEITKLLLDTLRCVLFDRLMRWLDHGHRAWCKLLILQVVVVWWGDLRWVDRCKTLSHHLTPLVLFIAIYLLEEAWELLSNIHRLRFWYELVDFKRFTCSRLDAVCRRDLGVRRLFLTWWGLLWRLVHCHGSQSSYLLNRLSRIQFIFHGWRLSMRCDLDVIIINLESCKLTSAKDQLVLK